MSLSRWRGFFRRWERSIPKDSLGVALRDLYDVERMGMQLPRHIKVRICHIPRRRWVRRFSLHAFRSPNRVLQSTISTLESVLNTFWSLRRDAIVGSVVTLGMMLVLFDAIDRPEPTLPEPVPQAEWKPPPPAPLIMTGGDPYIRALMRTISASESNVEYPYSVLYGGQYVRDLKRHPDKCVTIVVGPNKGDCTTAAGRYQMLSTTWEIKSERYHPQRLDGGSSYSFEPEFQDEVVYAWLSDDSAWGGVDLADLLRQGRIDDVLKILSPTWTSLGYGIETNSMSEYLPEIYQDVLAQECGEWGARCRVPAERVQIDRGKS